MSILVLGIESSCDETGIALYDNQQGCIASALHSQLETHRKYGGVVPELASRDHILNLHQLLQQCLQKGNKALTDINAIAYTKGPGLASALLTGATFAKSLAWSLNIPAIGVHHMEGHLLSPLLEFKQIKLPFMALLISGGHTQLVYTKQWGEYKVLGQSLDDAVGEAFDKSAKLLGLDYPGGAQLATLAEKGNAQMIQFTKPLTRRAGSKLSDENRLNFSFSGLKTEMRNAFLSKKYKQEDLAASLQQAISETLALKVRWALSDYPVQQMVIAGGVASNLLIRQTLTQVAKEANAQAFFPSLRLCTDNGEMIALAGALRFISSDKNVEIESDAIEILPRWDLQSLGKFNNS